MFGDRHWPRDAKPLRHALISWNLVAPFLNPKDVSGPRCSLMAKAVEDYHRSVSQQLGVTPQDVCFEFLMPHRLRSNQLLSLQYIKSLESDLSGGVYPVHAYGVASIACISHGQRPSTMKTGTFFPGVTH